MTQTIEPADSAVKVQAPEYEKYRSITHFGNLDGLRFICISMVLWHHCQPLRIEGLQILNRGFLGVDFFFVLSGFLITTLLLREADRYGSFSLWNFYLRRILRIIPVYYFIVTSVSVYYIFIKGEGHYAELVPWYYLFQANFLTTDIPLLGPTWSLSVEEQYYAIWPLIMLILPMRWLTPVSIFLIIVNVAAIMGLFGIEPIAAGPLLFKLPNATYAPIIIGSLGAVLLHRRNSFEIIHWLAGTGAAQIVSFFALICALQLFPEDLRGLPNLIIHLLMAFVLFTLVVREKSVFTPFLSLPLVARIGAISYGIYLYHLLGLDITNRLFAHAGLANKWMLFFCYSVVSCLIAEMSFRTLETFFHRFRPARRSRST